MEGDIQHLLAQQGSALTRTMESHPPLRLHQVSVVWGYSSLIEVLAEVLHDLVPRALSTTSRVSHIRGILDAFACIGCTMVVFRRI